MPTGYTYGGDLQIRQDAGTPSPGTISGAIVVYGDVAPSPHGGLGPERMAAGAWGPDVDRQPWTANLMHNRSREIGRTGDGLTLTDTSAALLADLVLPDTDPGRETAMLARKGVLTGLSGEFDILQEYRADDGVREVVRVAGDAVGVVTRPAYRQSQISIRQNGVANVLLSGPAGGGKSAAARELLAELPRSVLADFQSLYAAILGILRLDTGRYPERLETQAYALQMAELLRTVVIRSAAENELTVIATNSDSSPERREHLLGLLGGPGHAEERIIDPGIRTVTERLSGGGSISEQCAAAMSRWYGTEEVREHLDARRRRRRTVI